MNELIKIENKKGIETVNARDLHEFLEVKTKFSDWIKSRIEKFSFEENTDFVKVSVKKDTLGGYQQSIEYHISIDMAKQLSMVENNDKGIEARKYFINCEKNLKIIHENIPALIRAEIKKQLKLSAPIVSEVKILKRYKKHENEIVKVEYNGKTYLINQNFYNKNKFDLRYDEPDREWGSEIKTGFITFNQVIKYIQRNF